MFKRLQSRYLHKWTSAIDGIEELSVDEWARGLSGLTGEQIKRGLDDWVSDWPPSVTEFRACCLGWQSWHHKTAAYRIVEKDRLLPSLPGANSKQALDELKSMLGVNNAQDDDDNGEYLNYQALLAEKLHFERQLEMAKEAGKTELIGQIEGEIAGIEQKIKSIRS